jgi:hypothetical protein
MPIRVLTLVAVVLVLAGKDKEDPRLARVEKVFVSGNSRSANEVRKTLSDLRGKTRWKNICISGVTGKDDADATLEVSEAVPLGGTGKTEARLPSSSATLTLKSSDLIWSNDSEYSSVFILKRLNDAVCRAKAGK